MIIRILLSVVVSLVAVVLFSNLCKSRFGSLGALGLSVVGFFFAPFLFAGLMLHMAATFLASVLCLLANPPKSVVAGLMIAAMVVGYAGGLLTTLPELYWLARLRQEFPLESLAERLDYEQASFAVRNVSIQPGLSSAVERRLAEFEQRDESGRRRRTLEFLHRRYRDDFILATGFGPGRMMGIYRDAIVVQDLGSVPLADRSARQPDSNASAPPAGQAAEQVFPRRPRLADLHDAGLRDLLDPGRFGYVQDKQHVAGFEAHRFTQMPKPAADPDRRWELARLELIGLLKYDRPKAYVLEFLPRLDELGEAATRDVSEFEAAALERLKTQEDLVIDEAPERIRMVGSLRAGKDCLECHSVRRGELIGALSYEIVPRDNKGIVAARD